MRTASELDGRIRIQFLAGGICKSKGIKRMGFGAFLARAHGIPGSSTSGGH